MDPSAICVRSLITSPAGFKAYEMEDDVVKDLSEFALANAIYAALVEGHAAETNARCASHSVDERDVTEVLFTDETPWTMPPRTPPT